MRIQVLPDSVINRIAAGEVIERPQSVVKELVDNALDAGSTEIVVTLENGGQSLIIVRDDGIGMSRDEAVLAFERHATSKVKNIDDLWSLDTYGFRGEALSSIASVSKVRLSTRMAADSVGCEVVFMGGRLDGVRSTPWASGSQVEVRQLFFNVPARRKFLKSHRAELARIKTWLLQSSLARPDVRYQLVHDGETIFTLPRVDSAPIRAKSLFRGDLEQLNFENPVGISLSGLVAHPGEARGDVGGFAVLVNNRLVQDRLILKAVREGFESTLKSEEIPLGYIALTLDPRSVDINVHPQKSEVRFSDTRLVFESVRSAVNASVRNFRRPVVTPSFYAHSRTTPIVIHEAPSLSGSLALYPVTPIQTSYSSMSHHTEIKNTDAVSFSSASTQTFAFSELSYIGQILECYLVCQHEGELVVIDMHAAHERVNYNKIRHALSARVSLSQQLLVPLVVHVGPVEVERIRDLIPFLGTHGFDVRIENDTVHVFSAPALFGEFDLPGFIREVAAEDLCEAAPFIIEERINHIAARKACHASVRSGQTLSREEAHALFRALDEAEFSGACPHGRPVIVHFKKSDVERWFGRDK